MGWSLPCVGSVVHYVLSLVSFLKMSSAASIVSLDDIGGLRFLHEILHFCGPQVFCGR